MSAPKKILIVDDSLVSISMAEEGLRANGFKNVVTAKSADEGLSKVKTEGPFDLILTDWNTPEKSGLELVEEIRADENAKEIPIIIVTSRGNKMDLLKAAQAGATSYIVKPFNASQLRDKLNEIFNK